VEDDDSHLGDEEEMEKRDRHSLRRVGLVAPPSQPVQSTREGPEGSLNSFFCSKPPLEDHRKMETSMRG